MTCVRSARIRRGLPKTFRSGLPVYLPASRSKIEMTKMFKTKPVLTLTTFCFFVACAGPHSKTVFYPSQTSVQWECDTPISGYDQKLVKQVHERWLDLLASHSFPARTGTVVVLARQKYDGGIASTSFESNDVGQILGWLCQRAILDPSPYAPFPSSVGRSERVLRITFRYAKPH